MLGVDEGRLRAGQDLARQTMIDGDWIVRAGTPLEETVPALARIVKEELKLPVEIVLEEVERPVWVVTGEYHYTPYDLPDEDQPAAWRPDKDTHEMIKIFGSEIFIRHNEGSYGGSYDEFLAALSKWIRARSFRR